MLTITEIRIKLARRQTDKLRAFGSITFEGALVVRDIKVIEKGTALFVAMPSRKICDYCPRCRGKNYVKARYCNGCGAELAEYRAGTDERGRPQLYSDVAHPINREAREQIQSAVLAAYRRELEASKRDGYVEVDLHDDCEFGEEDFA